MTTTNDTSRIIANLRAKGCTHGHSYLNPEDDSIRLATGGITDANFPSTAEPSLDGARLDKILGSREYILAELSRIDRRAATVAELLLYGIKNPEEHRKQGRIYALAQVCGEGAFAKIVLLDMERNTRTIRTRDAVMEVDSGSVLSFPL